MRAGRADRGERARDARGMRVILASMARGGERGARGASAERITRENTAQPNRHSNNQGEQSSGGILHEGRPSPWRCLG